MFDEMRRLPYHGTLAPLQKLLGASPCVLSLLHARCSQAPGQASTVCALMDPAYTATQRLSLAVLIRCILCHCANLSHRDDALDPGAWSHTYRCLDNRGLM